MVDIIHWLRISRNKEIALNARNAATDVARAVRTMQQEIDRLTLLCTAVCELLAEKHGVSMDELQDRINEIDLRDGVLDGKRTPTPKRCSQCARINNAARTACVYCGADLANDVATQPGAAPNAGGAAGEEMGSPRG